MAKISDQIIEAVTAYKLTQGIKAGQELTVLPWQRRFLRAVFDDASVQEAALSMARGGGKTTFLAALCVSFLQVPDLMEPKSAVTVMAGTKKQAGFLFGHAAAFASQTFMPLKIFNQAERMEIIRTDIEMKVSVHGANPNALHGDAPKLVLADEVAQWAPTKAARIVAALRTGFGKIPDGKMISTGTRADSESHIFGQLIQQADVSHVYAAAKKDAPFQRVTWNKANPSLRVKDDTFAPLVQTYRREAARAKQDAAIFQSFQALRLNMGVSDVLETKVITDDQYRDNATFGAPVIDGQYALGVDLGQTGAMSAIAAYCVKTGHVDCRAWFGNVPDIKRRAKLDGVGNAYDLMVQRGELFAMMRAVVPVEMLLEWALANWGVPHMIVSDRWRQGELIDGLNAARMPLAKLELRGQGFKDGAEDVRKFRRMVLNGDVRFPDSLLLRSAFAEARTVSDGAGNEKLSKKTEGGRRLRAKDDAAAAAILAVSAAYDIRKSRTGRQQTLFRHAVI